MAGQSLSFCRANASDATANREMRATGRKNLQIVES